MNLKFRTYSGAADQQWMLDLVRQSRQDHLHTIDLPYRFSSRAFDDPQSIGLWMDASERLRAWAVLQSPFWSIDMACPQEESGELLSQILTWADQRAHEILDQPNGRPIWFVNVSDDRQDQIEVLEQAGFADQGGVPVNPWLKVLLARSAQTPLAAAPLPEGFTLRPWTGEAEVEAYAALHCTAFGSANMTPEWRARVLKRPEHRPELDLVVIAPDGRPVAFCIAWFDPEGYEGRPAGQIEPMGVHPEHHRRGLGRAVLAEALRRLHLHGVERVVVESDVSPGSPLGFYEAAGFRITHRVRVYRKDYSR